MHGSNNYKTMVLHTLKCDERGPHVANHVKFIFGEGTISFHVGNLGTK